MRAHFVGCFINSRRVIGFGFFEIKGKLLCKKLKTNFPNDANERFEENISITFVESNSGTLYGRKLRKGVGTILKSRLLGVMVCNELKWEKYNRQGKDAHFNNRKDNNHKTIQKFNNDRDHSSFLSSRAK